MTRKAMTFVERCVEDSLPIWQACLDSEFLVQMAEGTLDPACFEGYLIDDSLYLVQYAKVLALGMLGTDNPQIMRVFYSFLAFVNEGEGSTRLQYLEKLGLSDEWVQTQAPRAENRTYTDYMLKVSREGSPECMLASLPCTLSYGWIFARMLRDHPELRDSFYWPMIRDYTGSGYEALCRRWMDFAGELCRDLPEERLKRCMEIFRESSRLELGFWEMSRTPRENGAGR